MNREVLGTNSRPVAVPGRVGQATAVEQSRAVAEVIASVQMAETRPRVIARCEAEMRDACSRKSLAEIAFYAYSQGGERVTGPSVHLARELALIWGNVTWGSHEMRRDEEAGQSEILAFAWDLESNSRPVATTIVPHRRSATGATQTDPNTVRQIIANAAARTVRERILESLPAWFVEDAKARCWATLEQDAAAEELPQRIAKAVVGFARIHITEDQLVSKIGLPRSEWTTTELTRLGVIFRAIERGETNRDEEFPGGPVASTDDLGKRPKRKAADATPVTGEVPDHAWAAPHEIADEIASDETAGRE